MCYKTIAAVFAALTGAAAFASATFDDGTGILTFDVAPGQSETYSSIGAAVTKVVKTGGGSMKVTAAANAAFTGKTVEVTQGVLEMGTKDSLGTANTVTVAKDAQLLMSFDGEYGKALGSLNDIVIAGAGPDGTGAIKLAGNGRDDGFLGNVALSGDATIGHYSTKYLGIGNATLDLSGHTLTVGGTGSGTFVFDGGLVVKPGHVLVSGHTTLIQGSVEFQGDETSSLTMDAAGKYLDFYNSLLPIPWTLNYKAGYVSTSSSKRNGVLDETVNKWSGPVNIYADLQLIGGDNGSSILISGRISQVGGDRSLTVGRSKPLIILSNPGNATSLHGCTAANQGTVRGLVYGSLPEENLSIPGKCVVQIQVGEGFHTAAQAATVLSKASTWNSLANSGTVSIHTVSDFVFDAPIPSFSSSLTLTHTGVGNLTFAGGVNLPKLTYVQSDGSDLSFGGGTTAPSSIDTLALSMGTGSVTVDDGTLASKSLTLTSGEMSVADGRIDADAVTVSGGTLTVKDGGVLYASAADKSVFTIGGANAESNARLVVESGGLIDAKPPASGNVTAQIKLGDSGTKPAIMEVRAGATVTNHIMGATAAEDKYAYYQYGGDFYDTTYGGGNGGELAGYGTGYFGLFGGNYTFRGYLTLVNHTGRIVVDQTGGLFNAKSFAEGVLFAYNGNAEYRLKGGTLKLDVKSKMGAWPYAMEATRSTPGGSAVISLYGDGNPRFEAVNFEMCERTNGFVAVMNLNAGVFESGKVLGHATADSRTYSRAWVNFNGGTYRIRSDAECYFYHDIYSPSAITVFEKGALFDTAGKDSVRMSSYYSGDTVLSFRGPTGRGVKSIRLPDNAVRTGYAGAVQVVISGGGGEGATASLEFDATTGTIGDIVVTCPGWDYSEPPTATIKGPDWTTDVVCEVELTDEDQKTGPIIKIGEGSLDFNSATATYDGTFVVSNGTFKIPTANELSPRVKFRLAGGKIDYDWKVRTISELGGWGEVCCYPDQRWDLTVSDALRFDLADVVAGRVLNMTSNGHLVLGENAKIVFENVAATEAFAERKASFTFFNFPSPLAALPPCEGLPEGWRLSLVNGGKSLKLWHPYGGAVLIVR